MKLLLVIATPVAIALTAMPAQAQDRVVHSSTVTSHVEKSVHRDDDVAPHHGWRNKRVCKTRWVQHHKVRSCTNLRVRW